MEALGAALGRSSSGLFESLLPPASLHRTPFLPPSHPLPFPNASENLSKLSKPLLLRCSAGPARAPPHGNPSVWRRRDPPGQETSGSDAEGHHRRAPPRRPRPPQQIVSREIWTPSGVVKVTPKPDFQRSRSRRPPSNSPRSAPPERKVDPGAWRLYQVKVPLDVDPGKDDISVHSFLREEVARRLLCKAERLQGDVISIVRKSFDARKKEKPVFVYIVDVSAAAVTAAHSKAPHNLKKLKMKPGLFERAPADSEQTTKGLEYDVLSNEVGEGSLELDGYDDTSDGALPVRLTGRTAPRYVGPRKDRDELEAEEEVERREESEESASSSRGDATSGGSIQKEKAIVVGSGPAGLFAALALAEAGIKVTVVERGQPVERRGRDIGALMVRRSLNADSNYCYGEGGAGTWSDGKLTTRIGKNSEEVREVLRKLVQFGGPERILVDGKPHLGTDRLVRMLRAFREHLEGLGVEMRFGEIVDDLVIQSGQVTGALVRNLSTGASEVMSADSVVLGVGHSARDVYTMLEGHEVHMAQKDFAAGFRIEHPQALIDRIQYREWADSVDRGRGKVPVADYTLAAQERGDNRSCFSFCMCPGGQVVPTSTNADELCVNGMSFSRRASQWANAALVVPVSAPDFVEFGGDSPLAGVAFQRAMERRAAAMGGGNFVAPVQRAADFLDGVLSADPLPSSSYRLGVRSARLDELYPDVVTASLRQALLAFDKMMPGFVSPDALLHGVETRTSAPVRIERDPATLQSVSHPGLYPIGEGAGYAGGIVSSAVDGMRVGNAIVRTMRGEGAESSEAKESEFEAALV
ncbi:hypothetical protein KFL_000880030 [Klebsormidium nitens]|uniref:FAD-binding domain-containing protein n=1 Tax=Klebsormidium nitens TaxID=105231 RepID=A0A1Y1HWY4_KLENI|nr:hypothetical protein KFL_000880030 [Klebsormidium nitens]|eukprot:GAQ81689.1 hypothetical protein KFL_000880030 [Klebsormidium nitens]